jgi:hypothetical protein
MNMALDTNQFIDLTDVCSRSGFTITTEDPDLLREWAQEEMPERTCAITGGGESIYLGFLPHGGQVIGVDAAYNALAATYLKGKLIENYSTQDLKKLIDQGVVDFNEALRQFLPTLPERLRRSVEGTREIVGSTDPYYKELWESFSKIWLDTPEEVIDSSRRNLGNLVLVHGDMAECTKWGRFQLVYPSNAVGWPGVTRTPLNIHDLMLLTDDAGCVLSSLELPRDRTGTFELEKTANGTISDHQYFLYRKNERIWSNPIAKACRSGRKAINQSLLRYFF